MEYFNKWRTCSRCQKLFREKDNICKLKCGNHSQFFDGKKWLCCGDMNIKEWGAPCVRYDHYDDETKGDILKIELKEEYKEVIDNLQEIIKKKNVLIKAKDMKLYCSRNQNGKLKLKNI